MEKIAEVWVGVDISKKYLDIHANPTRKMLKLENSPEGIQELINQLEHYDVKQIACEATGGYKQLLGKLLRASNYSLWIIDPRRVKGFI